MLRSIRRLAWRLALLTFVVAAASASVVPAATAWANELVATDSAVTWSGTGGPIQFRVKLVPGKISLSDEVRLELEVEHDPSVVLEFPDLAAAWQEVGSPFRLLDRQQPLAQSRGTRSVTRQIYRLAPTRTGKLALEPVLMGYTDRRGDSPPHRGIVESAPLSLTVTTVLPAEASDLSSLKPAAPPGDLAVPRTAAWLAYGSAAIGTLGLLCWIWRRFRRRPAERELTPRERAELALARLMGSELARKDVKAFYVELTGIVRRYIEQTKGLRAPEQTTEEFLQEATVARLFADDERRRLQEFLETADLVKYAALRPLSHDLADSVARAKAFMGLASWEAIA